MEGTTSKKDILEEGDSHRMPSKNPETSADMCSCSNSCCPDVTEAQSEAKDKEKVIIKDSTS